MWNRQCPGLYHPWLTSEVKPVLPWWNVVFSLNIRSIKMLLEGWGGVQRWAHFPLKYPCWALSQERKSCWLVNDWVFVRRDRTKNLEDKTSGGREGAKGDVKTGREGRWGRGTGGLPRASAGAENLSEIGYCADGLHLLWQWVIAKSPPPPLTCPPPPWAASITTAVCQAHGTESITASLTSRVRLI